MVALAKKAQGGGGTQKRTGRGVTLTHRRAGHRNAKKERDTERYREGLRNVQKGRDTER